jgi:hypothetical protein
MELCRQQAKQECRHRWGFHSIVPLSRMRPKDV